MGGLQVLGSQLSAPFSFVGGTAELAGFFCFSPGWKAKARRAVEGGRGCLELAAGVCARWW